MAILSTRQGVIAGIGDKSINANVITPDFDARIRNFLFGCDTTPYGRNGIFKGLDIISSPKTLTAGMCIADGYIGELPQDTPIPSGTNSIYARFTLNNDREKVDSFEILFCDNKAGEDHTDLQAPNSFLLWLYEGLTSKAAHFQYPWQAKYSDVSQRIADGGSLGKNVTGVTPEVNDYSYKVATTEYVYNKIKQKINADKANGAISVAGGGTYSLERKAKLCTLTFSLNIGGRTSVGAGTILFVVPDGFKPSSLTTIYRLDVTYVGTGSTIIQIDTDGRVKVVAGDIGTTGDNLYQYYFTCGYEIK